MKRAIIAIGIAVTLFVGLRAYKIQKCDYLSKQLQLKRGENMQSYFDECVNAGGSQEQCALELLSFASFLVKLDQSVLNENGCE